MNKRVLVVCTTDSMIWNFLILHIQELIKRGYEVECACSQTGSYFYELREKYGFIMHSIPVARSPFKFANIRAYSELVQIIKSRKINNIFCHEPMGGVLGRLAGKKCKCTVYYMAHGFHFYHGAPTINRILYYNVEKFLSRYTDILITINKEDYTASKQFYAENVYLTHGIGVNTRKFSKIEMSKDILREEFSLDGIAKKILTVGELIPRKNHETIVKAMVGIDENIHLFIAGEGELDNFLKMLCVKLGVQDRVHFLGYRKDVRDLCCSVDAFVFPSVQEGLSVALMEAMGCGLPVIASNIRGNQDLIVNEKGGYLVSTFDIKAYSQRIIDLLLNPNFMKKASEFNQNYVSKFDICVVINELKYIYP